MFVHWSRDESTYRDMEKINAICNRCNSEQSHTFRLYEKKTKHYSVVSVGSEKHVTAICHGCLTESELEKNEEKSLIRRYTNQIRNQEGFQFIDEKQYNKAIKKFKKNLKDDPSDVNAFYGLAKCNIAQGRYADADNNIKFLEEHLPEDQDVKELRNILEANKV